MWHSGAAGRVRLPVAGLTPAHALLHNNLRQVAHTLVPLSPSTISWYWCKNREGNGRGVVNHPCHCVLAHCWLKTMETEMSAAPDMLQSHERAILTWVTLPFTRAGNAQLLLTISPPILLRLYNLLYWSNPPFLIFDIRALWCTGLSARAPESQKLKMVDWTSMVLDPSKLGHQQLGTAGTEGVN